MTKKLSADKSKGSKQRRPIQKHRKQHADDKSRPEGQGPTRPEEEPTNQGIPEEHYYGERVSRTPGNPGAIDEETLSDDAPYNRTYGRQKPDGG